MRSEDKTMTKISLVARAIVMGLLPVITICFVMLVMNRNGFSVFWPTSNNPIHSDGLMYYQMVSNTLSADENKGVFGINESEAKVGNAYVWSPVRNINWIIMGKIFGWHINSPWIYNTIMLSIAFFIFALVTEVGWRAIFKMYILLAPFLGFSGIFLSGLSEASTYVYLIIFLALSIKWSQEKIVYGIEVLLAYILLTILFLMRPYFAILFLVLVYYHSKYGNKKNTLRLLFLLIPILTILYVIFNRYLVATSSGNYVGAQTLASGTDSIITKAEIVIQTLVNSVAQIVLVIKHTLLSNENDTNIVFYSTTTIGVILAIELIYLIKKKIVCGNEKILIELWLVVSIVISVLIFLTCSFQVALRHVAFISLVLIILFIIKEHSEKTSLLYFNVFIIFFISLPVFIQNNGVIPLFNEEKLLAINDINNKFIEENDAEGKWDNTIDWVCEDYFIDEGGNKCYFSTDYSYLYGLTSQMGISVCNSQFIIDNIDNLKSRYIYINRGGAMESLMVENGKELIYSNDAISIYKLR